MKMGLNQPEIPIQKVQQPQKNKKSKNFTLGAEPNQLKSNNKSNKDTDSGKKDTANNQVCSWRNFNIQSANMKKTQQPKSPMTTNVMQGSQYVKKQ